ncbi:uncharacterized protein LOC100276157 [Zea mays]|uniref:Uncharacterized protein n=1 Tax=Zea mays TaxID=4577 RepID=A0A804N6V8_MAIZE|nr:uncharacterized protein LOC100276157 [Zea mays]
MAGVEEVRGAGEVVRGHCGNARTVFGGLPPRMAALRSRGGDGDGGWTPKRSPTTAVPPTRESGTQWRRHRWHRCRVVPSCTPPTPARSFPRPTSAATSFLSSRSTYFRTLDAATWMVSHRCRRPRARSSGRSPGRQRSCF